MQSSATLSQARENIAGLDVISGMAGANDMNWFKFVAATSSDFIGK